MKSSHKKIYARNKNDRKFKPKKTFLNIGSEKNKKGNRLFTKEDVNNYQKIYFLVKERGYTLKGAKEKLKGNPEDLENQKQIVSKLRKVKSFLHNLKDQL